MKRLSLPGLALAAFYIVAAIAIIHDDRVTPRSFASGFATMGVLFPAMPLLVLLHPKVDLFNDFHLALAILYCALHYYFLGWFIGKAIRFLGNLL